MPPNDKRKLGRYEVIAELGKGAMGTVYKALDPLLGRTVALKTISVAPNEPEMAEYKSRLFQEAKAVGSLNHPNIVTIYDVGESGDLPFLALEFLEGSDLASLTTRGVPLPVERAVDVALQVAQGLACAHAHGVLHRDIKPANIMLVHDKLVKIADFGIARMRTAQRAETTSAGSPRYMSPEQALGKRADHRSDIFSLGVVLYEMLTGMPPFSGADLNAILFQIMNLVPPLPSAVNPAVPTVLDFIVSKALAKAPEERYESAKAFADDLEQCRAKLGPEPRVTGVATPVQPALPKIDPYAATPLLEQSFPQARQSDAHAKTAGATTLDLSKEFEAMPAMARLASQTGVAQNLEELKGEDAANAPTVHGKLVREQSSNIVSGTVRWTRSDRLIFAASVATAAVIGVLIVLA